MVDRRQQRYNHTPKKNKCKRCGLLKRAHICVANHKQEDDPGTQEDDPGTQEGDLRIEEHDLCAQEGDLRIEEHDLCTQEDDVWNLLAEGVVDPVSVLGTNAGSSSLDYQAILRDDQLKVLDPAFVMGTNTGLSLFDYEEILRDKFLKILIDADPLVVPWTPIALP